MKKIIPLVVLSGFMQSCEILRDLTLNFYAGLGKTSIVNPEEDNSFVDPVGAQIGIESKIVEVNKKSALVSGLNFSMQGADYVDPGVSGTVKLSYVNVPFLYSYDFSKKIYAELGLQPGLLIGAKDKYNGDSYDYKDYVKKFHLGLPVGVGYRINDHFSVGVKGTYGLTKINKTDDSNDHNLLVLGFVSYTIDWPR